MLNIALKEWAVVTDLMREGTLSLLLRKGGIHERGGVFTLEHDRFALFPAWMHQRAEGLKPAWADRVTAFGEEPEEVTFTAMGEQARVWQITSREAFDQLDDLHVWAKPQIDMRFNYKPERPLYLLAVRVYALAQPKAVVNHWKYKGCRSWVELLPGDEVDERGAQPVVDDASFARLLERVDAALA